MKRRFLALDRGKHIRSADRYAALVGECFADLDWRVVEDLARVPYSHAIVVATRPSPGHQRQAQLSPIEQPLQDE